MNDMTSRPLSPHLQVYRPQLTSLLSITHRTTGVLLSLGSLVLLYWLVAAATGPEAYARAQSVLGCIWSKLLLAGWTWALFYHLCNGIRHLCWDAGKGLDLKTAYASGYTVIACSLVLTALTWACVIAQSGGAQ
jgi:succinate dehydrogenase / fumarate reductase cytochrome b subunit